MWKIAYAASSALAADRKALARESAATAGRIRSAIERLAQDPLGIPGVKLLVPASAGLFRIKISDWRVVFALDRGNRAILVVRIARRKDVYR